MREEHFYLDRRGALVRSVAPARGNPYEPYEHRCDEDSFKQIAHAIDEHNGRGFTLEELSEAEGLPSTRVATTLAFLKERGCVVAGEGRRSYAASTCVHLDAMTEYHALRKGAEQQA